MIDEAATLKDEPLRASEDNNEKLPQSPSSEKDEKQLKNDTEDVDGAKDSGEEKKKKAVDDPDSKVLHGFQLWAVYFSLLFSIFLVH
ncbi:hypothetical protein BT69DRAFT_1355024 [Atractiella rhizophila]|nr:hypothetical protein BT69DRAFT_1355024 [Atractiella rhizophila]